MCCASKVSVQLVDIDFVTISLNVADNIHQLCSTFTCDSAVRFHKTTVITHNNKLNILFSFVFLSTGY